jgi:hypothetical protein
MSRTFDEVVSDLITYVLRKNKKTDVSQGQVVRDIIDASANEMSSLYSDIDSVRNAQSLVNANSMSISDLDKFGANYGLLRKTATKSIGTVTFYSTSQPTADLEIPVGTRIATSTDSGNSQIVFTVINTVKFIAANESLYYNPVNGYWELDADVQAETAGVSGNVGPYSIIEVLNFDMPFNVQNTASTYGGTDKETNENFAYRILNSFIGNNKGTKNGYTSTVLSQENVLDALVVGPNDDLMTRDGGLGGKVDIWILSNSYSPTEINSDTYSGLSFTWLKESQYLNGFKFNFPILPVDVESAMTVTADVGDANPVTGITIYESRNPAPSGTGYCDKGEYHYTFYKSDDLENAHSYKANDYIIWNSNVIEKLYNYPVSGVNNKITLNIDYSYDHLCTSQLLLAHGHEDQLNSFHLLIHLSNLVIRL